MIYLDNAATTVRKPERVREAMLNAFDNFGNPGRGLHKEALGAAECVFTARERAARLFGAESPEEIVFTQNATHALNIAIKGIAKKGTCVISGYEHNSVIRPLVSLKEKGVFYQVAESPLFDPEGFLCSFSRAIRGNTRFAVCTHMSNVFGYILPIKEIDEICYRKGIPLIVDASQSAGSISLKLSELKATVCICAPGHKGLYGPQGTGILACKDGKKLKTLLEGGTGSNSQSYLQPQFLPDKFESGTQNIPGIAGLSEGIAFVLEKGTHLILKHEQALMKILIRELSKSDGIRLFAPKSKQLQGGVLSFYLENEDVEITAERLAQKGIAVRSGMQCSPLAHKTAGTENGTVRVSASYFTTENEIEKFVMALLGKNY